MSKKLEELKKLALEIGESYKDNIKIEIDVCPKKKSTKIKITEFNL